MKFVLFSSLLICLLFLFACRSVDQYGSLNQQLIGTCFSVEQIDRALILKYEEEGFPVVEWIESPDLSETVVRISGTDGETAYLASTGSVPNEPSLQSLRGHVHRTLGLAGDSLFFEKSSVAAFERAVRKLLSNKQKVIGDYWDIKF